MKFPDHILLDNFIPTSQNSTPYWAFKYLSDFDTKSSTYSSWSLYKWFFSKKNTNTTKVTIKSKTFIAKRAYLNLSFFGTSIKNSSEPSTGESNKFKNARQSFNAELFNRLFTLKIANKKPLTSEISNLWTLFDINFLKKEKIYTKLKYSRVPQYDIVSGGSAALLSGFLGFLISEKFGIEMVDSGDFYYLFMYLVFFSFVFRPFLRIMFEKGPDYSFFSFRLFFIFYKILTALTFKHCKRVCNLFIK